MYSAEEGARRRPWVLGLIVVVHLLLGYLFFSMSVPTAEPGRPYSGVGGFAGGTGLAAPAPPAKTPKGFTLSFDRAPLVGPSTYAPPARAAETTHKVAPSSHPS